MSLDVLSDIYLHRWRTRFIVSMCAFNLTGWPKQQRCRVLLWKYQTGTGFDACLFVSWSNKRQTSGASRRAWWSEQLRAQGKPRINTIKANARERRGARGRSGGHADAPGSPLTCQGPRGARARLTAVVLWTPSRSSWVLSRLVRLPAEPAVRTGCSTRFRGCSGSVRRFGFVAESSDFDHKDQLWPAHLWLLLDPHERFSL